RRLLRQEDGTRFYDYRDGAEKPAPQTEAPQTPAGKITVYGECDIADAMVERLQHSGLSFGRALASDGRLLEIGRAVIYITDGRSATQRASESGV
ncbi:hypothetical protein ACNJEG_21310, partial [Mycobacterium tuberculosis]